jgi:DNA-binding transcriptional ArsR family regulator
LRHFDENPSAWWWWCRANAATGAVWRLRPLARGSHTTGELALAWDLTPPEVSRHLAVLRRAGLLTAERRRRDVHYAVDLTALTALGTDLLAAVLR